MVWIVAVVITMNKMIDWSDLLVKQFPAKLFIRLFPEYSVIVEDIVKDDEKYVVRYDDEKPSIEVGYPEDDWTLTLDT